MAAPFHRILSKTDRAIVAYINATVTGITDLSDMVWPARRSLDKAVPGVVVYSESWTSQPGDAAYTIKATITVKTEVSLHHGESEPTRRLESEDFSGQIFDAFYLSEGGGIGFTTLEDAITDAARDLSGTDPDNNGDLADFKCDYASITGGNLAIDEDKNFWMDTLELELNCRAVTDSEP